MTGTDTPARKRVRRGEGEVTQWPRGVASYVPQGPEETAPDPEEDRVRNRLLLAGRLIGILRTQGADVDRHVRDLRSVEQAFRDGDRAGAAARVDRLLGELDRLLGRPSGA